MEGDILDPYTGEMSVGLTAPEQLLASDAKKKGDTRALMDIRSINDPSIDPEELYYRSKQDVDMYGGADLIKDELRVFAAKKEQEAMEAAIEADIRDPESMVRSENILKGAHLIQEKFADLDGYYQAVLEAGAPDDVPTLRAKREAVKGYAFSILEDLSEGENTLDKVINGVSLLAPDFIKDASDLVDGGVFTSISDLKGFVHKFQSFTPDEQTVLIEEIVPQMYKAYDKNSYKVMGMLATLFNTSGASDDLNLGAMLDVTALGDVYLAIKAAKVWKATKSLATRAADSDAIEAAAARQRVASVNNPVAEEAIGMSRADAAHTANPMATRLIDEGASVDGIAGDIDILTRASARVIKEETLPVTANKLPPALFKALRNEQTITGRALAAVPNDKALQARLKEINAKLEAGSNARAAEKDLSLMRQGVIPERFQTQFDAAVEVIKAEVRVQKKAAQTAESAVNMDAAASLGKVELVKTSMPKILEDLILPDAFTGEEQAYAIAKAHERIGKELSDAQTSITSMNVVARDREGFSIEYTTAAGASERQTYKFTRDDVGSVLSKNESKDFKQRAVNYIGKVLTPDLLTQAIFPKLVPDTTFLGQQTAKTKNRLARLWQDAEAGLSREELYEVDTLIMAGDELERVLTIAELRAGLPEVKAGTIKLNDRQIESFYAKRTYLDELHKIRGLMLKRQLEIEDFATLNYNGSLGASKLIGRRRKTFSFDGIEANDLFFAPGMKVEFQSLEAVKFSSAKYKEDGFEIIELFEPKRTKEGKDVKFALAHKDDKWTDLPDEMLNYQAGYVPRIYDKGYYYVRAMDSVNKEVLYGFPTKALAKEWSDAAPGRTAVFADREFNKIEALLEEANAYGGLFTGTRKQRVLMIKDGPNEFRPERMTLGQATERYVQNISAIMSYNEYRATAVERWKATVNSVAEAQGRTGITKHNTFDGPIDLPKDTKDVFEQTRQYIQDVMKMPSREERVTESIMLGAANMMYGKPFSSKPRKWLLDHSQGEVTSWIKGHVFNLHMGFGNLRQLPIQAFNASLAMSMHPLHAIPALGDAFALRTVALLPEAKAIEAAKYLHLGDDIVESLMQYNKSGLRDSIVRQADFDMNKAGIAHGSLDVARKLSKAGLVPFMEGENFARLISWSIARRKWKEGNPGKSISDKSIISISQDTTRMLLNMQSENAAWWQRAPGLNLATQFIQVYAKFIENMLPRALGGSNRWSRKDKLAVLTGQLFLYGVVGIPVAEEAVVHGANIEGITPQEFIKKYPNFTTQVNEGFTGMVLAAAGVDVSVAESMNLIAGIDDIVIFELAGGIIDVINGGYSEEGAIEVFSGPTANIMRRTGDVFGGIFLSLKTLYEVPSGEVAYQAVISNLDNIAAMTSTWSNARKLWTLHSTDRLYSTRGTLIASKKDLGDMNLQTQLGISWGFPTKIEQLHYANALTVKEERQFKTEASKDIKNAMLEFSRTGNEALYKGKLYTLTAPFNMEERRQLMQGLNKEVFQGKTALDTQVKAMNKMFLESGGRIEPNTAQSILLNKGQE